MAMMVSSVAGSLYLWRGLLKLMRGRLCRWACSWGRVLRRGGGAPSSHADTHVGQGREARRSETTRHRDRRGEGNSSRNTMAKHAKKVEEGRGLTW